MKLRRVLAGLWLTLVFSPLLSLGCSEGILALGEYSFSSFDRSPAHRFAITSFPIVSTPTDGGVKENVPTKYKERFARWKNELLSTDFGREQWNKYAENKSFVLKIVVVGDRGHGAGTDNLKWNEEGKLVGATITLGSDIESGYPNAIYYPVLNSLKPDSTKEIEGTILAATKLAHEIGHVNQALAADMKFLQLQHKLTPIYNSIFRKNGLKANDQQLIELAEEMKGTPIEIWEGREYRSELNALLFLSERIGKERYFCDVFKRIRQNVEAFAGPWEKQFIAQPEFAASPCFK